MEQTETLEDFYHRKFDWMPDTVRDDLGHFNIFRLEPFVGDHAKPVPYKRRDFYKIMFVKGKSRVHFADRVIDIRNQAISFSNPHIPYKWEHLENISSGVFCIFNSHFFHQFGNLSHYEVFQPSGTHVFELRDDQAEKINAVYNRMFEEINSDYIHKYDVLRNLVFELLHFASRLQPGATADRHRVNASQRISMLFLELLERQFPVDDNHLKINLRSAAEFASQLNIHVNHLNRALRETTSRTTSQIIGERLLQEAKILLKQSNWSVTDIAYSLGFTEVTHFNNFFRKHVPVSPLKYRNV